MEYDVSDSLVVVDCMRELKMALKSRQYKHRNLIHHSDRGLQYCSNEYQSAPVKNKITPSMTEIYDRYANAVAERINGILKDEFMIEQYDLDKSTMQLYVKDCIERYNNIRPHYSCHMLTPDKMHRQDKIKMRTYKKSVSLKASLQTYG